MEDTLRVVVSERVQDKLDSLNPYSIGRYSTRLAKGETDGREYIVLILILLEDTLRVVLLNLVLYFVVRLNPYSIGRYSTRAFRNMLYAIWSSVLILILLEDTLRDLWAARMAINFSVLILILLEDTLRVKLTHSYQHIVLCLNPYSIGRYSTR